MRRTNTSTNRSNGGDEGDGEDATPHVVVALSSLLESLVARNDDLLPRLVDDQPGGGGGGGGSRTLDSFRAPRPPSIGIGKYLDRIYRYTLCSPACFVAAFVYVDRLIHAHPHALVSSLNVHRLLLASLVVASKVVEDENYDNAFYARVGGVSNAELNRLELELLFLLDFGVTVTSTVFDNYRIHLEKHMMLRGGQVKVDRPFAVELPSS